MYAIDFRDDKNLLDIRWNGPFEPDAVLAYARDLKARFVARGFKPGYKLRIDMRDANVQTRDALAAFERGFAGFPKASRIAIVVGSTLSKLQVRRIMTQPYLEIFEQAEPAFDWLVAEGGVIDG